MKKISNLFKIKVDTPNEVYNVLLFSILVIIPLLPLKFEYNYNYQLLIIAGLFIICGLTTILLIISERIKNKNKKREKTKLRIIHYLVITYVILIAMSTFTSKYYPDTILGSLGRSEGMLTLYMYLGILLFSYHFFDPNKWLFKSMAVSSILVSAFGIIQALLNTTRYSYAGTATFGNPNFFSTYLNIFLPIFLILYLRKGKLLYFIASLFTFAALVCTKTTGAYLCFAIYFIIIIINSIVKKVKFTRILVVLLCFAAIFITLCHYTNNKYFKEIFTQLSNDFKRLTNITNMNSITIVDETDKIYYLATNKKDELKDTVNNHKGNNIEDELTEPEKSHSDKLSDKISEITGLKRQSKYMLFNKRGYIYHLCFEILKDNILFGIGPDTLGQEVLDNYFTTPEYKLYYPLHLVDKAHSEYIQIAVTTGIPSLIVYLAMIIYISVKLLKKYKENTNNVYVFAIGMSILAYLVQAAFNISVTHVAPMFWIMLGIGLNISEKGYEQHD